MIAIWWANNKFIVHSCAREHTTHVQEKPSLGFHVREEEKTFFKLCAFYASSYIAVLEQQNSKVHFDPLSHTLETYSMWPAINNDEQKRRLNGKGRRGLLFMVVGRTHTSIVERRIEPCWSSQIRTIATKEEVEVEWEAFPFPFRSSLGMQRDVWCIFSPSEYKYVSKKIRTERRRNER